MIIPERVFGNLFDDERITSSRLANFAGDCKNRLTNANTGGEYVALITQLDTPLANLRQELSELDTSQAQQKGKTQTVNQQLTMFKKTMSDKEGVIADAVGGYDSAAYLEFYPQGLNEYSKATITQMPTLVKRVNTAATKYAAQLSPALVATLQGFESSWFATRDEQEKIKGAVKDNRADRSDARTEVELALLIIIHSLALKFPGDLEQCSAFFDFNLLAGVTRSGKKKDVNGDTNVSPLK
jgi:hypothetical protein